MTQTSSLREKYGIKYKELVQEELANGFNDHFARARAANRVAKLRTGFDPATVKGLTEDAGADLLYDNGYFMYVLSRRNSVTGSEQYQPDLLTCREDRVDVHVRDGVIKKIHWTNKNKQA